MAVNRAMSAAEAEEPTAPGPKDPADDQERHREELDDGQHGALGHALAVFDKIAEVAAAGHAGGHPAPVRRRGGLVPRHPPGAGDHLQHPCHLPVGVRIDVAGQVAVDLDAGGGPLLGAQGDHRGAVADVAADPMVVHAGHDVAGALDQARSAGTGPQARIQGVDHRPRAFQGGVNGGGVGDLPGDHLHGRPPGGQRLRGVGHEGDDLIAAEQQILDELLADGTDSPEHGDLHLSPNGCSCTDVFPAP